MGLVKKEMMEYAESLQFEKNDLLNQLKNRKSLEKEFEDIKDDIDSLCNDLKEETESKTRKDIYDDIEGKHDELNNVQHKLNELDEMEQRVKEIDEEMKA